MLKKLIRFHSDGLLLYTGVEGGFFLLFEVIACCVMYFDRPGDSVSMGWTMFPIAAGFISLIAVSGHAAVTFDMALRFVQTRRRALIFAAALAGGSSLTPFCSGLGTRDFGLSGVVSRSRG